jgi:hypothetical protein
MKFGKITAGNVSHDALSLGGVLAGGALSNGLMTFVPADQVLLARGGMTAIGLAGAASIKGKSSSDNLVKFALLGFAVAQGTALVKKYAGDQVQIDEASTSSEKFVAGMVGLGCACDGGDSPALGASPIINFPALEPSSTYDGGNNNTVPTGAF